MPVSNASQPQLYLDIDGVVIAESPPFESVRLNPLDHYCPEVATRIARTGIALVWLSTWENEAHYLSKEVEAFRKARVLNLVQPQRDSNSIMRKMMALIADQQNNPTPFIWADDAITTEVKQKISEELHTPNIIIQPNTSVGITEYSLTQIESFAKEYQS